MLKISSDLKKYFKRFHSSPEAIMTFVYMRLRYSLSYRDLEEMTGTRADIAIDHATLQRWVYRFSKLIEDKVRKKKWPVKGSWRMDETYVKVSGKWLYLYWTVDLRVNRDMKAAEAFFKRSINNTFLKKINLDKSGSNT